MPTWEELTAEQKAQVVEVMRQNAATAGVTLAGAVTISAEGEELVVPKKAV